jgi:predicted metal-dependent hydrolase
MDAIVVRTVDFDVERGAGGLWNPRLPEVSHSLNAFQLALPYLEPYFIEAVKEGARAVGPRLRAEADAFCAQEANHARQHGRYNRLLRRRYPRIEAFERELQRSLLRSRKSEPLAWRLAFTAGCEAITGELARFLFCRAERWFRDADGHFAALMLWHAVEEIEHQSVAFAILRAAGVPYGLRLRGLAAAIDQMVFALDPVTTHLLEVDGVRGPASTLRRRAFQADFVAAVLPRLVRYAAPGYQPSDPRPPVARDWMRAFAGGAPLRVLDTTRPITAPTPP